MRTDITVNVVVEGRPDGGIRVWSEDLPGLILSGKEKAKVLASIKPACKALLKEQGVYFDDLRIDADFIHGATP